MTLTEPLKAVPPQKVNLSREWCDLLNRASFRFNPHYDLASGAIVEFNSWATD